MDRGQTKHAVQPRRDPLTLTSRSRPPASSRPSSGFLYALRAATHVLTTLHDERQLLVTKWLTRKHDSRMVVCFLLAQPAKKCDTNHTPRTTA